MRFTLEDPGKGQKEKMSIKRKAKKRYGGKGRREDDRERRLERRDRNEKDTYQHFNDKLMITGPGDLAGRECPSDVSQRRVARAKACV